MEKISHFLPLFREIKKWNEKSNESLTCFVSRVETRAPSPSSLSTRSHSLANPFSILKRVCYPCTCPQGRLGTFWYCAPSGTRSSHPRDPLPPRRNHPDSPESLSWCGLVYGEIKIMNRVTRIYISLEILN